MCVAEHSRHVFRVIRFFHPSYPRPPQDTFLQSVPSLPGGLVTSFPSHIPVMGAEKAIPALQTGETKIQIPDQTHVSLDLQSQPPTSFFFSVGGKLLHSVKLVSAIQQQESAILIHVPLRKILPLPPCLSRSSQSARLSSLCFAAASLPSHLVCIRRCSYANATPSICPALLPLLSSQVRSSVSDGVCASILSLQIG